MAAYYNEIDPFAAQWLRNLIARGLIAPGDVDERSIVDVRADDLRGYRQCHFFAGIGIWSYALRQAGFRDDEEVWTGSCPCQPFSDAGKGEAFDDERDLWPEFFRLIRERRPRLVAGEQVASRLGLAWIDALHADLEGEAYTVGAVDTCSAGVGSPNIRQRLYWVAHAGEGGREVERQARLHGDGQRRNDAAGRGADGRLADADGERGCRGQSREEDAADAGVASEALRLADTDGRNERERGLQRGGEHGREPQDGGAGGVADSDEGQRGSRRNGPGTANRAHGELAGRGDSCDRPGPLNGFWRVADWLCCTDGKWRPVEPGAFPLVAGTPGRLGRLRAYGNAINAQVAVEFLRACRQGQ